MSYKTREEWKQRWDDLHIQLNADEEAVQTKDSGKYFVTSWGRVISIIKRKDEEW